MSDLRSQPRTQDIISPKLSTSFLDQSFDWEATLNRRLILSSWCRSLSLLSLSLLFLFTHLSDCFPLVFVPAPGALRDRRRADCGFTAISLRSSSSATAMFGQFAVSHQSGGPGYLRLERAATIVSSSIDPAPPGAEVGSIGRIACSRPSRYLSTFLERFPSPAVKSRSGCRQVDKLVK